MIQALPHVKDKSALITPADKGKMEPVVKMDNFSQADDSASHAGVNVSNLLAASDWCDQQRWDDKKFKKGYDDFDRDEFDKKWKWWCKNPVASRKAWKNNKVAWDDDYKSWFRCNESPFYSDWCRWPQYCEAKWKDWAKPSSWYYKDSSCPSWASWKESSCVEQYCDYEWDSCSSCFCKERSFSHCKCCKTAPDLGSVTGTTWESAFRNYGRL